MKNERCRHERNSWLLCGGYVEWCYVCGAFREMHAVDGVNVVIPRTKWVKPTGDRHDNPYEKMKDL